MAQSAAIASLAAEDELLERVVDDRGRARTDPGRAARPGLAGAAAEGNFVWFRLGERTDEFAAACERAGIIVRPFSGEGARVTIGEAEANDVLLRVAAEFAPA